MNSASALAKHYAALPSDFRHQHPMPRINITHAEVVAWLNRLHKAVEVTCVNLLNMITNADACGDLESVVILLAEVKPYSDVLGDLNQLIRNGQKAREAVAD